MATRLKEIDVVMLGVGLVGSIVGRELTKAGLEVVGLERGEPRYTVPDFQGPAMHDELRYSIRKSLMMDAAKETYTFRNSASQTALTLASRGQVIMCASLILASLGMTPFRIGHTDSSEIVRQLADGTNRSKIRLS